MALKAVRALAVSLACAVVLAAVACAKTPDAADAKKPVDAAGIGDDDRGIATYSVAGSSHAHGVATYRLANPKTHRAALELFVADGTGRSYVDVIKSGKRDLAIAPDGVVLHAIGTAGVQEERAFLKAMGSPLPQRPLRASATFTSILLGDNDAKESTSGTPSRSYKLFGMFRDGDDVELYLEVANDGSSVTFSEKDPDYRPSLTRFLST